MSSQTELEISFQILFLENMSTIYTHISSIVNESESTGSQSVRVRALELEILE